MTKIATSEIFKQLCEAYAPHEILIAVASGTPLLLNGEKYIVTSLIDTTSTDSDEEELL